MSRIDPNYAAVQTLCRMCDNHCAITVYRDRDGRVVDLDAFAAHPWGRGRICSKAHGAVDIANHPDRLRKPLKKTNGGWEVIDLPQALDEIAGRIRDLQSRYGPQSMAVWKGEATGFNQQETLAKRFCRALGTPNFLSVDSLCFASRMMGYSLVYGCWPKADVVNARCIVIWAANPPTSHPPLTRMIMDARADGANLVVVDPRLSMIARQADVHAAPRPGTDGALAWGLIHRLIESGHYDRELIENHSIGFDKIAAYARAFTPSRVEAETGVPAAEVERIAACMQAALPRVAIYLGNGIEHYDNGLENTRAIAYLDALCGAFDVAGGSLDVEVPGERTVTLYDELPLEDLAPIAADEFPVLYDFRRERNTMRALDDMLAGGPNAVRGMILTAGNPIMTNPNARKVERALAALDLLVVRELFMTRCAELADYVLPAAMFLERTELYCHAQIQTLSLCNRVTTIAGVQDEYRFWHDMAHRLGFGAHFPWRDETEFNAWLLEPTGIDLEALAQHPEGIQYKPIGYRKWRQRALTTPTGKVEFASAYLRDLGYSEIAEYRPPYHTREPHPGYPFVLIAGARDTLTYHSSYKRVPRFRDARGPFVEMHPSDAARLGVSEGDAVTLASTVGSIRIPVRVMADNEITPGVLQATTGWAEANVNIVTRDDVLDPVSGFPMQKGVPVRVEPVA